MKIGFIGSGPISDFHLSALLRNDFQVEALGTRKNSRNCEEFAKRNNLLEKYCKGGWEEVLSRNCDAYIICINPSFTYEIIKNALDKSKPILVEKPVTFSLSKINELCKHPNSNKVFVGYNRRFYKTTSKLEEICSKLEGGTVLANIPDSLSGIKQFLENGSHIIDILRYVLGDFDLIEKKIKINKNKTDLDSISALCGNDIWNILINAHSLIPSNFSITVNSNKNVYELKPIEQFSHFQGMEVIEPSKNQPIRKYIPKLKNSFYEDIELKPGFNLMYKEFMKFVLGKDCKYCSILEAKKTLQLSWSLVDSEISKFFIP